VFEADLPKRLRKFQLALGGKESSGILHVPRCIESVAIGSQKRLEMVLGNPVICPVLIHHALPAVDHAPRAAFLRALSGESLHFNTFFRIAKLDFVAQSPIASGSSIGLSTHVHDAPSGEVFFQGRDQARHQTGT